MAPAALGRCLFGGRSHQKAKAKAPRTLRRLDPTLPCSIAKLSEDLILHIFGLVQAASPHSAANLALVHPRFYRLGRYVQHRCVAIDLGNEHEAAAKRLDLIEKDGLLPAIQELRVLSSRFRNPNPQCLSRLAAMVAGMTALRSVHWESSPIPTTVLESLRKLPFPVRLHVVVGDKYGRDSAATATQLLAALAGCDALVSITLEAEYTNATGCLQLSQPLKQLLLTCPNLVNLSVDLHLPRQGCVAFGPPDEYPGLGFSGGEHPLRPLESLTIHEYPWGEEAVPGRFAFHSLGYPSKGREMDYWATNFDWSALRRLEAVAPSTQVQLATTSQVLFANTLAPRLTALREVRFTMAQDPLGNSLQTFFGQVPTALEAISVQSLDAIGAAGLARHAPTLRRLTVHQLEPSSDPNAWEEHLLSEAALGDLLAEAPHLEELGIDMLRVGGDWPREKLDVLARFPRLRLLELWFGFGDWSALGPPQPALTASSAAQLFADLRRACPTLQQLLVHSGCPPPPEFGMPVSFGSSYAEDNAASFTCRVPERDDEAAAGEVAVTSLRLSPRLNARMQRIIKGEEKREDIQGNLITLRVALDGPLQHADWERWKKEWPMPYLPELMDAAEGRVSDKNRPSRGRLSKLWRR